MIGGRSTLDEYTHAFSHYRVKALAHHRAPASSHKTERSLLWPISRMR